MRVASELRFRRGARAAVAALLIGACSSSHGGGHEDPATSDAGIAAAAGQGGRAPAPIGEGGSSAAAGSGSDPKIPPTRPPESPTADAGLAPGDAGSPRSSDPCVLPPELGGPDRQALDRLGLFGRGAVVEGVLLRATDIEGRAFARVSLERVWFGWGFLAGIEVLIPMAPETYAEFGDGARVILAVGGNGNRPSASTLMTEVPIWEPLSAVVRAEHTCTAAPLVGYQPWKASAVGIVKIVAQDELRTTFEVVETLAGELPAQFMENWYAEWQLPYFGVSEAEYIASIEWFDDSFGLGSVVDIRPNDPAEREEVEAALARWRDPDSPERSYLARLQDAAQTALTTRTAWLYNRAALVATLEVTGKSPKCCASLDRVYLAGEVREVFSGAAPGGPLITLHDGGWPGDACGERFIYALSPVATLSEDGEAFACGDQPANRTYSGATASQHTHRMPATPENAAAAAHWVASAPPLYRLHPAEQTALPELFAAPDTSAMWSTPLAPEAALAAGQLVLLTVERVVEHAEGHEVVLTTQFSPWPALDHLQERELKLFFADGDLRLLEAGRTWLAVVAIPTDSALWMDGAPAAIAAGELFIVPGLLLPSRDEIRQAATVLRTYPDPGVSVLNPP